MDAKYYKDKFHEAREASKEPTNGYNEKHYSHAMLSALWEMAKNDVYPDGHFSDEDCNIWSLFSMAFEGNKATKEA